MPLLPKSVRFVYFDLGRVLLFFDWKRARLRIAEESPLSPEEIDRSFRANVPWTEFELGRIDESDFFDLAQRAVSFQGSRAALKSAFCEIFTPMTENITLAREIAAERPGAVGLLSNTNSSHIAAVAEAFPDVLAPFALRLYSFELGLRKPDPAIYRAAAEAACTAAGNILFLDDLEENTRAAEEAGWQTIHCPVGTDLRVHLEARFPEDDARKM